MRYAASYLSRGDGAHVPARIGVYRAGVLALNLGAPILRIGNFRREPNCRRLRHVLSFDTAMWGMEAVAQVTFAAQAAQKDLIIGIIVPETPEERTSEQESSDFVFRD